MSDGTRKNEHGRDDDLNNTLEKHALEIVVKKTVFPGQKWLHLDQLEYSNNRHSLCVLIAGSTGKEVGNGIGAVREKWWAKIKPVVKKVMSQERNVKSSAIQGAFFGEGFD